MTNSPENLSYEIRLKVGFLRAMLDIMTREDVDAFVEACTNLFTSTATSRDLNTLDRLFNKFNKDPK